MKVLLTAKLKSQKKMKKMKREQDTHHSCKKLYNKATPSNDVDDIVYKEKKKGVTRVGKQKEGGKSTK